MGYLTENSNLIKIDYNKIKDKAKYVKNNV
jgi:hypothetical protein